MIAIIGHICGPGKALFGKFPGKWTGFSRTNGYDITNMHSVREIADASSDFDVFINNAHRSFGQGHMLYEMHERRKNTNKLIINIPSNGGDCIKKFEHLYAIQKSALDEVAEQLSNINRLCMIANVRQRYINTESVNQVTDYAKIRLASIVDIIVFLIKSPIEYSINLMTVLPRANI